MPSTAVQVSQSGTYVFVVRTVLPTCSRSRSRACSAASPCSSGGLKGGEMVVTNGQLLLSNGTKVAAREPKAGS